MTSPSRSGTRPRALLGTAAVAVALAAADTYVVVLALTDMMTGVGIGIDALQQATPIISGFLLGYIAVLPLIGRLADLVDRQKVLLGCLVVFVIGSVVTALAADLPVLISGRVVQGVGGGGLVPATLAITADLWPIERRAVPLGVVGAVQELGSVLGPLLGALVLVVADWRAIFWLNAVLGVLLGIGIAVTGGVRPGRPRVGMAVLGLLGVLAWALTLAAPRGLVASVAYGGPFVPFGDSSSRVLSPIGLVAIGLVLALAAVTAPRWWPLLVRADVVGGLLLGGALSCVILTFAAADPETEVVGPLGYALLPIGALLAAGFGWRQARARDPLIPRGTLRRRTSVSLAVSLLVGVALVAVVVDVPLLARLTYTDSQTVAALVLLRFLVAVPVGAVVAGWLVRRYGDAVVTAGGLTLAAGGLLASSYWGEGALGEWHSYVVLGILGLGVGLALTPVNNVALADSPPSSHGTIASLVIVLRMTGMVVGVAVLTGIGLHAYYQHVAALPDPTDGAALVGAAVVQVQTALLGAAVAAALGAVLSIGLREQRAIRRPEPVAAL